MLHLSSEQTEINGFQFMHTSYQRKNFIYYLEDQSCEVLFAFSECPQSPVKETRCIRQGRLLSSSWKAHSATHTIQENFNGSRIGPLTGLGALVLSKG